MVKIALLTTSRADWGHLERLARLIDKDRYCDLQLIVGGVHLSVEHGMTVNEIDILPSATVECLLSSDSRTAVAKSIGLSCISCADVLRNLEPDWLIVLGDRFEVFSVVATAHTLGIPVAHISGGEVTTGSLDDGWRHCITKLSYLHFVYAEEYRKRVVQLGEHPDRVFNVGHIGLEDVHQFKHIARNPYYVVMWHPETTRNSKEQGEDLGVLLAFLAEIDGHLVFFTSQGDSGSRKINKEIKRFCEKPGRTYTVNLDRELFLTILGGAKALIGNSSAGIYEAPAMGVPSINIGTRQQGRIKSNSIIECPMNWSALRNAFNCLAEIGVGEIKYFRAEDGLEHHHHARTGLSINGSKWHSMSVSEKILNQIKKTQLPVEAKRFYDA